ncbi:hypothetical protein QJS10_CPB14g00437 [Acorus calamus]|uniref:Uncharacterized protein n=1 Tax=Acorus calamus TaxID=4465 RepID=A0AAV9DDD6_ACOCL|nr:hypothetical protein QJS10_CPB14g00437 [Acorus calamus]
MSSIRDHILSKFKCVCGAANVLADDLLPNKTLRETIDRMLESSSGSAENTRSFPQVQDLVSAHPSQLKAPSPTLSALSSKKRMSGDIAANVPPQSAEKKTSNSTDQSGVTLDSISTKVRTSQEGGLPSEEDQRKPMVSKQVSDMQRKEDFEDYGAEAIPLGQNGYNPYWGAMQMQCGVDPYVAYPLSMPYMGPFDASFGGALPQYPFGWSA